MKIIASFPAALVAVLLFVFVHLPLLVGLVGLVLLVLAAGVAAALVAAVCVGLGFVEGLLLKVGR